MQEVESKMRVKDRKTQRISLGASVALHQRAEAEGKTFEAAMAELMAGTTQEARAPLLFAVAPVKNNTGGPRPSSVYRSTGEEQCPDI